jgi:hypothetical protein
MRVSVRFDRKLDARQHGGNALSPPHLHAPVIEQHRMHGHP